MEVEFFLCKGEYFSKRQEGITPTTPQGRQKCLLKADEDGMFLTWAFSSSKEIHTLECTRIREVKTGVTLKDVKVLCEIGDNDVNIIARVLTIYHGPEIGTPIISQFIAESAAVASKWVAGLNKIIHSVKARHLSTLDIMKKQWRRLRLSQNSKGVIPIRRLVKHFGHDRNEKVILSKLLSCGFSYTKNAEIDPDGFTFDVYKKIHQKICQRDDLHVVFEEVVTNGSSHITLSQFVKWLNENQRDPRLNEILVPTFDDKAAKSIIEKYEHCSKNQKNNRLSLQGFSDYLASDDNMLVYPEHISVHQDMDQPLSHYFISSSHNTYLTGRQVHGKSSVDIYRHVLLSGCRCIELDCWDGKDGEPIITHGKAMCTDIVFKQALVAIKESAFITSDFPVILSFETRCSKVQQAKMAKYCEEIFGDLLLSKGLPNYPLEPGVPLPSPNTLKGKILIKNKRLDPEIEKAQLENIRREEEIVVEEETEEAHPELQAVQTSDKRATTPSPHNEATEELSSKNLVKETNTRNLDKTKVSVKKTVSSSASEKDEDDSLMATLEPYTKTSYTNIHPFLSSIVSYCQSVKFPGLKNFDGDSQKHCYQMSSFSETQGLGYVKSNPIEFVSYNRNQLSRIYPKGARIDSTNYMPQIFWDAGCQLVALNFQTNDLGMQLNTGKFDYNGRCGYLLKPKFLLRESKPFDLFTESTLDGVIAAQCGVKVISGQFISDKPITTYVEVEMCGLPNDTIRKEFRTSMIVGNGLNPQYNNEFLFRKVIYPDLALLRFTLYDDSKQLLGQRVVPLSGLQTGYRYVALRTASGIPLDSTTIFVKITLRSYVPDSLLAITNALENPKAHLALLDQHEQQLKCFEDDDSEDLPIPANNVKPSTTVEKNMSQINLISGETQQGTLRPAKEKKNKENVTAPNSSINNIHQTLYSKKSEEKRAMDDVLERAAVSMDMLFKHPIYLKALERHNKECNKMHKKLEKQRSKQKEMDEGKKSNSCCLFGATPRRRRNGASYKDHSPEMNGVDGFESTTKTTINGMCPDKKKAALVASLDAVHEEAIENLKTIQLNEMAGLTQSQTKQWMEDSKKISKDKTIPPPERERRIRDLQSLEVKRFMEERQTLKNRHGKQRSKLESFQLEEAEKMHKLIENELA
ncbi:unnamed protein product [Clavelina lepadiformis]|uniref:1-phosphatidylinositol 4,5-bisphosphate phosphodiesterase n=1 Tax=Clavelina lepadiformis TaxID=159417 RepID=A0ABP0F3W5_CLALP